MAEEVGPTPVLPTVSFKSVAVAYGPEEDQGHQHRNKRAPHICLRSRWRVLSRGARDLTATISKAIKGDGREPLSELDP